MGLDEFLVRVLWDKAVGGTRVTSVTRLRARSDLARLAQRLVLPSVVLFPGTVEFHSLVAEPDWVGEFSGDQLQMVTLADRDRLVGASIGEQWELYEQVGRPTPPDPDFDPSSPTLNPWRDRLRRVRRAADVDHLNERTETRSVCALTQTSGGSPLRLPRRRALVAAAACRVRSSRGAGSCGSFPPTR